MNKEEIEKIARNEIEQEDRRNAINAMKKKLREKKSFWDMIFPFTIIIRRK